MTPQNPLTLHVPGHPSAPVCFSTGTVDLFSGRLSTRHHSSRPSCPTSGGVTRTCACETGIPSPRSTVTVEGPLTPVGLMTIAPGLVSLRKGACAPLSEFTQRMEPWVSPYSIREFVELVAGDKIMKPEKESLVRYPRVRSKKEGSMTSTILFSVRSIFFFFFSFPLFFPFLCGKFTKSFHSLSNVLN